MTTSTLFSGAFSLCPLFFFPHQGVDGLPGSKGDTGDPGKSVSSSPLHHTPRHPRRSLIQKHERCCHHAMTAHIIVSLYCSGTTRSGRRAWAIWTAWAKGLCVFVFMCQCLHAPLMHSASLFSISCLIK